MFQVLSSSDDEDRMARERRGGCGDDPHTPSSQPQCLSLVSAGPTADSSALSRKEPSAVLIRARKKGGFG